MSTRTIAITHNGVQYFGEIMTVKRTMLGYEGHGIFTSYLFCEAPGSGVGVGGIALDQWSESADARIATTFGLTHITAVMATAGVEKWESLPGTQVVVLFKDYSGPGASPVGFAGLLNDKVLVFKEHAEEWLATEAVRP